MGNPESVISYVAGLHGMTLADMKSPSKVQSIVDVRHRAIYECWRNTDAKIREIAAAVNRDPSTISNAIRKTNGNIH